MKNIVSTIILKFFKIKSFIYLFIFIILFSGCIKDDSIALINDRWEYRIGFDEAWLTDSTGLSWGISKIPIVFKSFDWFDEYMGILTFRREIPEDIDRRLANNKLIAFKTGHITNEVNFYFNEHHIGVLNDKAETPINFYNEFIEILPGSAYKPGQKNYLYIIVDFNRRNKISGLLGPRFLLGPSRAVYNNYIMHLMLLIFFISLYFLIGIYQLLIGLSRFKETYYLYFGIYCLAFIFFIIVNTEARSVFFRTSYYASSIIDMLSFKLLFPAFVLFISRFFNEKHNKFSLVLVYIMLIHTVVDLLLAGRFLLFSERIFYGYLSVSFGYIIYETIKQVINKNKEAVILLIGIITLIPLTGQAILVYEGIVNFHYIYPYGFITFIISISIILLNRFIQMQNQLEELNVSLEERVMLRTRQLKKIVKKFKLTNKKLKVKNRLLANLSRTDSMTGLLNHKALHEILDNVLEDGKQYNFPVSVAMFDIDYFKKYNDTYGHQIGDQIIIRISKFLKESFRTFHFTNGLNINENNIKQLQSYKNYYALGRYGGDEFVIILPYYNEQDVKKVIDLLHKNISEINFKSLFNDTITVSFGVATLTENQISLTSKDILKLADQGLYMSKSNGRNQVTYLKYELQS